MRRCIEDEIARLVDLLDGLTVDADRELGGDAEPRLGWVDNGSGQKDGTDDREQDAGDEGEPDDDEEWSPSATSGIDQQGWCSGAGHDLEDETP